MIYRTKTANLILSNPEQKIASLAEELVLFVSQNVALADRASILYSVYYVIFTQLHSLARLF